MNIALTVLVVRQLFRERKLLMGPRTIGIMMLLVLVILPFYFGSGIFQTSVILTLFLIAMDLTLGAPVIIGFRGSKSFSPEIRVQDTLA